MEYKLKTPLTAADAAKLRAGDTVLLSGVIYTARDAAHKRLCECLDRGEEMPLDVKDAVIYYAGPTPPGRARPSGPAGPPPAIAWTPTPPGCWSWGCGA